MSGMTGATGPATTLQITDDDLGAYRRLFEPPDDAELSGSALDPSPEGFDTWAAWASRWWPTLIPWRSRRAGRAGRRGWAGPRYDALMITCLTRVNSSIPATPPSLP